MTQLYAILKIAAMLGILFLLALLSCVQVSDPDLWLHLKTGEWITTHLQVPYQDIFSFASTGHPWIDHEWLFQTLMYVIYHMGGINGLISLQTIIFISILALMSTYQWRYPLPLSRIALLLAAVLIFPLRLTLRPDIFSLLFFTVFLFVLLGKNNRRYREIILFFLQIAWVNMHVYAILGPIIAGLIFLGGWLTDRIYGLEKQDEQPKVHWGLLFLLLTSAFFINPYGIKGALYPFSFLVQIATETGIFNHVAELTSPLTNYDWHAAHYIAYLALIISSLFALAINYRRLNFRLVLLFLFILIFSSLAIRNLPYFAIAAYFIIVGTSNAITSPKTPDQNILSPLRLGIKIILILAMIAWGAAQARDVLSRGDTDPRTGRFHSLYAGGFSSSAFPQAAVDFCVANHIRGNMFNDLSSGSYLIGRLFPNVHVFIDGRVGFYAQDFFNTYDQIWYNGDRKTFDALTDKYQITSAFLNNTQGRIPIRVLKMLGSHRAWTLVYFNTDAVIFLKNVSQNVPLITKYAIDLTQWSPPQADIETNNEPAFITRAYLLLSIGLIEPAQKEVSSVLTFNPNSFDAHMLQGIISRSQKDHAAALKHFKYAVALSPQNPNAQYNLGLSYENMKDYPAAEKTFGHLWKIFPQQPLWGCALARILIEEDKDDQALNILRQLPFKEDAQFLEDMLQIGDLLFKKGKIGLMKEIYVKFLNKPFVPKHIQERIRQIYAVQE